MKRSTLIFKRIKAHHVHHVDCVTSDSQEQQCRQLMAGLDKVISDLDKQEKAIHAGLRPPLEQNRPLQDSADRMQDMRVGALTSLNLTEKTTIAFKYF